MNHDKSRERSSLTLPSHRLDASVPWPCSIEVDSLNILITLLIPAEILLLPSSAPAGVAIRETKVVSRAIDFRVQ